MLHCVKCDWLNSCLLTLCNKEATIIVALGGAPIGTAMTASMENCKKLFLQWMAESVVIAKVVAVFCGSPPIESLGDHERRELW